MFANRQEHVRDEVLPIKFSLNFVPVNTYQRHLDYICRRNGSAKKDGNRKQNTGCRR